MRKFEYYAPTSVSEALEILAREEGDTAIFAGGTDLMIEMNHRYKKPERVVDITRIKDLKYIREEDDMLKLGALYTFTMLEEEPTVKREFPALYETARYMGSPQIRSIATIGGNVVNASVAGDSPTVLQTLRSTVVLKSAAGERVLTIEEFNEGPGNCAIRKDELLTEIRIPKLTENEAASYFKIGRRKSLAIVVLAVSIYIRKNSENKIDAAIVTLGAVNKHPMRSAKIEKELLGREVTQESLYELLPLFTEEVQEAIANRPSVVYKREGVRGAAKACFDQILEKLA